MLFLFLTSTALRAAPPSILVLGDSISAAYGMDEADGWVQKLRQQLKDEQFPHQVINASISGDTTSGGLARLPAAFERHQPHILVIELGGNDGLRGLSLKKMRKNLSTMVQLCADSDCQAVILGMRIPDNYGGVYSKKFHASFAQVAEEHQVPVSPFFLEGVATDLDLMQADGIHPNEAAQQILLQNAWSLLKPLLQ